MRYRDNCLARMPGWQSFEFSVELSWKGFIAPSLNINRYVPAHTLQLQFFASAELGEKKEFSDLEWGKKKSRSSREIATREAPRSAGRVDLSPVPFSALSPTPLFYLVYPVHRCPVPNATPRLSNCVDFRVALIYLRRKRKSCYLAPWLPGN